MDSAYTEARGLAWSSQLTSCIHMALGQVDLDVIQMKYPAGSNK